MSRQVPFRIFGLGVLGLTIPLVFLTVNILVTSSTESYEVLGSTFGLIRIAAWPSSLMLYGLQEDTTALVKAGTLLLSVGINVGIYSIVGWFWQRLTQKAGE